MQECSVCGEEFEDKLIREEEGMKFCFYCGLGEEWINPNIRDIEEAMCKEWSISGEGREPIVTEWYEGSFHYVAADRWYVIRNCFELDRMTEGLNELYKLIREDYSYGIECVDAIARYYGYETTWENTYNTDCAFNGTLQYGVLYRPGSDLIYDDETIIALQWHGGGDVRRGYTKPLFVRPVDMSYFIMSIRQLNASDQEGNYWVSDNGGYEYRYEGNEGHRFEDTDFKDNLIIDGENEKIYWMFEGNEIIFGNIGADGF